MTHKLPALIVFLLVVFSSSVNTLEGGEGLQIYIAPEGNDAWSGSLPAPGSNQSDGPLATLDAARAKVREHIAAGLDQPITVLIRGGEYELSQTVVFTHEDSGTEDFPVHYKAFPGETPVITGGRRLSGWKPVIEEPAGLPEPARGKLWYCDIPADLGRSWQIKTLYQGKTLLKRSRSGELKASPEQVLDPLNAQPKDIRGLAWDADPVTFSREFRFRGEDLKNWATPGDIEILLSPKHRWLVNLLPLERIDPARKTAWFAVDATYGIRPGNAYYVENAIEYLDEPGEWVFNSREGRVYLWPQNPLAGADIRAPILQEFIRVEGIEDREPVRHIHFEGLTFRHGLRDTWKPGDKGLQHDWEMFDKGNAVLRFQHAERCSVVGCTFEASSGTGVRLDLYARHIRVADNIFAHLGGTGILLSGYGPGTKDENKFNTVTNNDIHHVGELYKHSPGIFITQSGHNLISHNTIHDLAYNGMIISGCRPHELVMAKPLRNRREWVSSIRVEEIGPYINDITPEMTRDWLNFDVGMIEPLLHARENRIEYNEIYRVMLELHDGNGIYFSAMGKNNRAVRNYFHDIYRSNGYIRLDDVSGYTIITHNVGERGSRVTQIKGPGDIRNNFAFDTEMFIARRWSHTEIDRFVLVNTPQGKHHFNQSNRFPDLNKVYEHFDRVSNSLVFDENPPEGIEPGMDMIAPDKRGGARVGMLFADPMFDEEARKQRIFRFLPGSPALELGIEPIDLSTAGSRLDPNREGRSWRIDSTEEWLLSRSRSDGLRIGAGHAWPDGPTGSYQSTVKIFNNPRSLKSITFQQSDAWQNWQPIEPIGPTNLGNAPVFLSLGPGNYWMFGQYQNAARRKGFDAQETRLEGFEVPLKTTPFPNQFDAPGGLKPGLGGYHAWQSRDLVHWVHHGPVTEKFSRWVTTAEHVNGKTFIYYDFPNDQDPHLYIDPDLTDGEPGRNMGVAFKDPSNGSDCAVIRDLEGRFHLIVEDWSPIDARKHSWDSPLALHAVSEDGIGNFQILKPPVDLRTTPTGVMAEHIHPHWTREDPDNFPESIARYEVHEPEQDAFGDWAAISIGGQYYLFGDFHPAGKKGRDSMSVAWFTAPGIDQPFEFCGNIGTGHPDPDIGFAEGRFYLVTQTRTDFVSPGPWVEQVEARVGVDTDNDGQLDVWSGWEEVRERYEAIRGFSKQVRRIPAALDLGELPEGYGFAFEFRTHDTTENPSLPVVDRVILRFD